MMFYAHNSQLGLTVLVPLGKAFIRKGEKGAEDRGSPNDDRLRDSDET